jgi:hypothetical protein
MMIPVREIRGGFEFDLSVKIRGKVFAVVCRSRYQNFFLAIRYYSGYHAT